MTSATPRRIARPNASHSVAADMAAQAVAFLSAQVGSAAAADGLRQSLQWGEELRAELRQLGLDADACAAGTLVPAIAAGHIDSEELVAHFPPVVCQLVDGVQHLEVFHELGAESPGAGVPTRRAERLRRLMLSMTEDTRVPVIKLASELIKLRNAEAFSPPELTETANRAMQLYAPLASRLGMGQFKWELEDLAFRTLDNARYKELARRLQERRADREARVESIMAELGDRLKRAGVSAEVSGRAKHILSIWRKMQRKDVDFNQLFDLSAVRVLVDDVAACYAALGVVHGAWTHIPGEFDDYITRPKRNGYRSLHTAVIGPQGRTMEVQIRSREMHAEAELGIAAHWRYKEGVTPLEPTPNENTMMARLRSLLEARTEDESGDFLLESMQSEAWDDHIYVLTPNGDIIEMAAGSTPLDFAYRVHTAVGNRCRGAKVNGKIVPLTHTLRSTDRVEILTAKQGTPSRDWINPHLGYLTTTRARAKVRQWFKQQDYDKNLHAGEELFREEIKRLGVEEPPAGKLLERFNYTRLNDFLAALGCGDVSTGQLASALQLLDPHLTERVVIKTPHPARKVPARSEAPVRIGDLGPVLTQLSRCCAPVPPEPISGFITRGRGVSVHRSDCGNLVRLGEEQAERLIEVDWTDIGSAGFPIDLKVTAHDRRGLLRDITTVLANADIDVAAIDAKGRRGSETVSIQLRVEVAELAQLSRAMDILTRVKSVTGVRRTG